MDSTSPQGLHRSAVPPEVTASSGSNHNNHHPEDEEEADKRSSTSDEETDSSTSSAMGDSSEDDRAEAVVADLTTREEEKVPLSATFVRILALLCACSLSIGSHYGAYFLGPLKSRLSRDIGTSNTEFSLLIAAYNLNNTWTPLVGGVMAARLGTALSSIIATSLIFLGQAILLLGDLSGNVKIMVCGLFIFGLGVSPLAVVQETIIVRFFSKHGLGVSMALGLVAGKGTSFLSAYTSYPLSQKYGPHAPFVVSTCLAALSFGFNFVYLMSANWFTRGARVAPEAADVHRRLSRSDVSLSMPRGRTSISRRDASFGSVTHESAGVFSRTGERMTEREALEKVAAKRNVKFGDLTKMGDVFWLYIGVNALCGVIWSPFTHLAANIIEKRYALTELEASNRASMLLAGSIVLYPLCGYLTDRLRKGPIVHHLFVLSSVLTLFCYLWLALPPSWTESPNPAVFAFATGHGFSTLLLVIIVPHLVPLPYVSTALGAHKSIESAGSTISKILAGLILDTKSKKSASAPSDPSDTSFPTASLLTPTTTTLSPPIDNAKAIQYLLNWWLFINVLQLLGTIILWKLDVRRKKLLGPGRSESLTRGGFEGYSPLPTEDAPRQSESRNAEDGVLGPDVVGRNPWAEEVSSPRNEGGSAGKYATWSAPSAHRPLLQGDASPVLPRTVVPLSDRGSPGRYPSYTDPTLQPEPSSPKSSRISYLLPPSKDVPIVGRSPIQRRRRSMSVGSAPGMINHGTMKDERRRGKWFMALSGLLVLITWALFWGTALSKMKQRSGSE